jgi:hypothetical protein
MKIRLEKRVRRAVLLFALVLLSPLSAASAQSRGVYAGVGISDFLVLPLLSFQVGGAVTDATELRATLDTLILANILSGELLFTRASTQALFGRRRRRGFGRRLRQRSRLSRDCRGRIPHRRRWGTHSIYGEAKPLLSPAILEGVPLLLFRSGVNFYF